MLSPTQQRPCASTAEKVSCLDKDERENQHLYSPPRRISISHQENRDIPSRTRSFNRYIFQQVERSLFFHMSLSQKKKQNWAQGNLFTHI